MSENTKNKTYLSPLVMKEINSAKKALRAELLSQSQFTDVIHKDSTDSINESDTVIVDLEIANAELQGKNSELEARIKTLEDMLINKEG